jgi:hypothetical protein
VRRRLALKVKRSARGGQRPLGHTRHHGFHHKTVEKGMANETNRGQALS